MVKSKKSSKKKKEKEVLKVIVTAKPEEKKPEEKKVEKKEVEELEEEQELIALQEETGEVDISKLFLKSDEKRSLEESIATFSPQRKEEKNKDALYKIGSKYNSSSKYERGGSKYEESRVDTNVIKKPEERESRMPFGEEARKDAVQELTNQDYQPQDRGYRQGEEEEFDNSFLRKTQKPF